MTIEPKTGPANAFRRSFIASLQNRVADDDGLAPLIAALGGTNCLEETAAAPCVAQDRLDAMLDNMRTDPDLAQTIRRFAPFAGWYRMLEEAPVDPVLAEGLVVGRPELPPDAPARIGLFLLGPNVHYPLHQHAALEVYFAVAGEMQLQHRTTGPAFRLAAGQHSVTPVNRVHSLTTGDSPCLLAYAWTGDLAAPGWWWDRAADGNWQRTRWDRRDDGRWIRQDTQPVTPDIWTQAGEI